MNANRKPVESLRISDFISHPVWEFSNDDALGETTVHPIQKIPVENLDGKLVGVKIQLANGSQLWASIGNVCARDPRSTQHFLTLSIEKNGQWFMLARYHDFNYSKYGPESLAGFLGLSLDEVFPISYDISNFAVGDRAALVGKIHKEPKEKLREAEIMAMALHRTA